MRVPQFRLRFLLLGTAFFAVSLMPLLKMQAMMDMEFESVQWGSVELWALLMTGLGQLLVAGSAVWLPLAALAFAIGRRSFGPRLIIALAAVELLAMAGFGWALQTHLVY